MFTVIETSVFIKYAKQIWSEDERLEFINWIALNPLAGDEYLTAADAVKYAGRAKAWASAAARE